MKKIIVTSLSLLFIAAAFLSFSKQAKTKVLVFSKTAGYHHSAIPNGIEAILKIGLKEGFAVDTTTDSTLFTDKNLKQYAAVIFLNTTGNLFDTLQEAALVRYIHSGGGFVGVHAATDAEYNWPWYGKMVGGYFESHPKQQQAKLTVVDNTHLSTKGLPKEWIRFDEWYNFKNLNKDVHVLVTIDESSYTGGKNGAFHPMAWWHDFEGGRVFYTELGHTEVSYTDPLYLQHLTGGILYAIGRKKS
ncbi:MAG TPA: ThuA domain-containing protein [Flavisolibacter sp.]|jgi:type 1 glutamine amidotransferase|nr:ThuA domain-containing protein [Flavisolibacter sp.]